VIGFLTEHLGYPVASPALFKRIGDRFSNAVRSFAEINGIPLLHLNTPDRVMALAGALCLTVHAIAGFNNRSLRALVGELLGTTYTASQMTYDLRRLRLHGLIARVPQSNTYFLIPRGTRVALFYTKVHDRLLTPLLAPDRPPAPVPLRRALHLIDQTVDSYVDHARIRPAA
jgi:hypothetical protein